MDVPKDRQSVLCEDKKLLPEHEITIYIVYSFFDARDGRIAQERSDLSRQQRLGTGSSNGGMSRAVVGFVRMESISVRVQV